MTVVHAGHSLRYRYGPASFSVTARDRDAGLWLSEFVQPWFSVEPPGPSDDSLSLTCSSEAFSKLERAAARAETQPLGCFALDQGVVELPAWREADAWWISETGRRSFFHVREGNVELVSPPQNRPARFSFMRILRELATTRMRAQFGSLDLHAAALEVDGRAVLLAGPKRSGKTTLLIHALGSGSAALLSNDRVLVAADEDPPVAFGVPTAIRIRPQTLDYFPRLRSGSPRGLRPLLLHRGELEDCAAGPLEHTRDEHLTLSPTQLAQRLETTCSASAPVAAVLFPEIDPLCTSWSLERLAPDVASIQLREGLYGASRGSRPDTVFEQILGSPHPESRESVARSFAECVPHFRCRLGPTAYEKRPGGRTLVHDIVDLAAHASESPR